MEKKLYTGLVAEKISFNDDLRADRVQSDCVISTITLYNDNQEEVEQGQCTPHPLFGYSYSFRSPKMVQ